MIAIEIEIITKIDGYHGVQEECLNLIITEEGAGVVAVGVVVVDAAAVEIDVNIKS